MPIINRDHPDLDGPQPTGLAAELTDLVERMVAAAPERRAKICAAGKRLGNAFAPPGQTTPANATRADKAVWGDIQMLEFLINQGISLHSSKAADLLYEELTRLWENSGRRNELRQPKLPTIRARLRQLRREFPEVITPLTEVIPDS